MLFRSANNRAHRLQRVDADECSAPPALFSPDGREHDEPSAAAMDVDAELDAARDARRSTDAPTAHDAGRMRVAIGCRHGCAGPGVHVTARVRARPSAREHVHGAPDAARLPRDVRCVERYGVASTSDLIRPNSSSGEVASSATRSIKSPVDARTSATTKIGRAHV